MYYKIITPSTEKELEEYYQLRWEILRAPWGKEKGSEKDEGEEASYHYAAQADNASIIGVIRLQPVTETLAQIRSMAVRDDYQGKGIGSALIKAAETKAREVGYTTIQLQARENAVNFYINNGYAVVEKTFLLFDVIQHYLMKKEISI